MAAAVETRIPVGRRIHVVNSGIEQGWIPKRTLGARGMVKRSDCQTTGAVVIGSCHVGPITCDAERVRQTKRGSQVPRTFTREQIGLHLRNALVQARGGRRQDGAWRRVLTWKPPHVVADQVAADIGADEAVLRREPCNSADPNAIQVMIDGQPIGYVEAWEAAHLQTAFEVSQDPVIVPVRRARRKRSPLFDVFLPDCHPAEVMPCGVCKAEAAMSREYRYGALDQVDSASAVMWTPVGWTQA